MGTNSDSCQVDKPVEFHLLKLSNEELQQGILNTHCMMRRWRGNSKEYKELYDHFRKLLEVQKGRAEI